MPKKRKDSDSYESNSNIEDKLLENLIKLQKVHTDLAEKFDKLSENISSLLSLFEHAAKNFTINPTLNIKESDKEFLEKIDKLLDQNKTIAKGLTVMEEKMKNKIIDHPAHNENPPFPPRLNNRPLPRF